MLFIDILSGEAKEEHKEENEFIEKIKKELISCEEYIDNNLSPLKIDSLYIYFKESNREISEEGLIDFFYKIKANILRYLTILFNINDHNFNEVIHYEGLLKKKMEKLDFYSIAEKYVSVINNFNGNMYELNKEIVTYSYKIVENLDKTLHHLKSTIDLIIQTDLSLVNVVKIQEYEDIISLKNEIKDMLSKYISKELLTQKSHRKKIYEIFNNKEQILDNMNVLKEAYKNLNYNRTKRYEKISSSLSDTIASNDTISSVSKKLSKDDQNKLIDMVYSVALGIEDYARVYSLLAFNTSTYKEVIKVVISTEA